MHKPLILHLSNDYPDPLRPDKTRAILHLVEATPEFRHVVYSLNRVNGFSGIAAIPFGEDRTAVAYGALPKGLFWEKRLGDVADWIAADLKAKAIVPDVIQAHKLTVEGLIGQKLAAEFGKPLICDIQGNTDVKLLRVKRSMRKRYRSIIESSSLLFPYAPWAMDRIDQMIGLPRGKCRCLPVLPGFDALTPSMPSTAKRVITLLRLSDWKNRNIAGVISAMRQLTAKYPALTLDIFGNGNARDFLALTTLIEKSGMADRIALKGHVTNNQLPQLLGQYSALVMPSFAESYGLVYAEALFCGVPVLYSQRRAIDGYFDVDSIGYACDPKSISDIAKGIDHLLTHEARLKQSIAHMQSNGALDNIRREGILGVYRKGLEAVLNEK